MTFDVIAIGLTIIILLCLYVCYNNDDDNMEE